MIWNDAGDSRPDLLLSIGTGMTSLACDGQLSPWSNGPYVEAGTTTGMRSKLTDMKGSSKTFLPKDLWDIVMHRLNSALRCDEIWRRFESETSSTLRGGTSNSDARLIRINPDLRSTVPELDAVSEIKRLEKAAATYLEQNWGKIREVGHRLIASAFFFEKQRRRGLECSGKWSCGVLQSIANKDQARSCVGSRMGPIMPRL